MEQEILFIKGEGKPLDENYANAIKLLRERRIEALEVKKGIKNTEPAPKYNPCRKFRKGDKVEYLPKDGRELFEAERLLTQTLTVVENEHEIYNRVEVKAQNGDIYSVPFYYLKLVTPVEELEPYYYVAKNDGVHPTFLVRNRNEEHRVAAICECWNEEDAQRICDMYNAEYRKGMER